MVTNFGCSHLLTAKFSSYLYAPLLLRLHIAFPPWCLNYWLKKMLYKLRRVWESPLEPPLAPLLGSPLEFLASKGSGEHSGTEECTGQPVGPDRLWLAKEHSITRFRWRHPANWVRLSQEAQRWWEASVVAFAWCLLGSGPSILAKKPSLTLTSSCKTEDSYFSCVNHQYKEPKKGTPRDQLYWACSPSNIVGLSELDKEYIFGKI